MSQVQQCSWGECTMAFPNSEQLYEHLVQKHIDSSKTSNGEYNCNWLHCQVSVSKRYRIISHLLCHVSFRPFKCPHCDKRFKRSHDARKHVKLIHEMSSSQLYYKRAKSKSRSSDSSPDLKSCDDLSQASNLSLSPRLEYADFKYSHKNQGSRGRESSTKSLKPSRTDALNLSFAKLVAYCEMVRSSEFKEHSIKKEVINL
eukprot:NODE_101_length_19951_cov_0.932501.p12 type:complete len:201 gc:universal NODE_101_length_19951_cov_0.932501:9103-8501(-)